MICSSFGALIPCVLSLIACMLCHVRALAWFRTLKLAPQWITSDALCSFDLQWPVHTLVHLFPINNRTNTTQVFSFLAASLTTPPSWCRLCSSAALHIQTSLAKWETGLTFGLLPCFTLLPADKFYEVRGYTMLDNSTTYEANTPFRLLGIFIHKTCWAFRDLRRALFTSQMLRTFLMSFWSLRAPICQSTNTVMWAPFV